MQAVGSTATTGDDEEDIHSLCECVHTLYIRRLCYTYMVHTCNPHHHVCVCVFSSGRCMQCRPAGWLLPCLPRLPTTAAAQTVPQETLRPIRQVEHPGSPNGCGLPPPPSPPSPPPLSKCQKYSPTEPNKAFEKAVSRRGGVGFEPAGAVMLSQSELLGARPAPLSREECITQYLEVSRHL